ncbi:HIT domain-containing protein [Patescibacteria group bacterium]|nr:HIT domain-containing protein [Patescibacteria group bacterium]
MDCIFCKIIKGEIPYDKVGETDKFLAFLDIRPLAVGHVLVIPKEHFRWIWDVPYVGEYFEYVAKVANAQKKALGLDMVKSIVVGDEVHHAHVHLVPYESSGKARGFDFTRFAEVSKQEKDEVLKKIRDSINL